MSNTARDLAEWVVGLNPTDADRALADRALHDSVGCAIAAREHGIVGRSRTLEEPGRWAVVTHVLDLDDLHLPSTAHLSTVCVPATLATGGGVRDYLAGSGVMARIGIALGWPHYKAGWHATTTAGAFGAAASAASAFELNAQQTAHAMALAVPAAGGVQRAFGTDAKALQVGFAVDAGIRAARLARDGVTADDTAVDVWLRLVGASSPRVSGLDASTAAVPGGLAIKLHPCCYASQRLIAAMHSVRSGVDPMRVERIVVHTPVGTVTPLIHERPRTGLEGKFSLKYAVAAALLDDYCGFDTFTDYGVQRQSAQRLIELTEVDLLDGGIGLLDGEVDLEVHAGADVRRARLAYPPGSPQRPPSDAEMGRKMEDCLTGSGLTPRDISWPTSAALLRSTITPGKHGHSRR